MQLAHLKIPSYVKVASYAWLSKAILFACRLSTIPWLMDYLGMEVYTIFVMLLSLEGWFLLSDFGIGLSLQNFLSEYRVGKKPITPLLQIAYLQSFLAFCLCVILLFCYMDCLSSFAFGIAIPSTPFVCASFLLLLGALGSVGSRVYYAMHKGAIVHIVQGAASLITWVAIYLLIT